jgi:hypothetical protein
VCVFDSPGRLPLVHDRHAAEGSTPAWVRPGRGNVPEMPGVGADDAHMPCSILTHRQITGARGCSHAGLVFWEQFMDIIGTVLEPARHSNQVIWTAIKDSSPPYLSANVTGSQSTLYAREILLARPMRFRPHITHRLPNMPESVSG